KIFESFGNVPGIVRRIVELAERRMIRGIANDQRDTIDPSRRIDGERWHSGRRGLLQGRLFFTSCLLTRCLLLQGSLLLLGRLFFPRRLHLQGSLPLLGLLLLARSLFFESGLLFLGRSLFLRRLPFQRGLTLLRCPLLSRSLLLQ